MTHPGKAVQLFMAVAITAGIAGGCATTPSEIITSPIPSTSAAPEGGEGGEGKEEKSKDLKWGNKFAQSSAQILTDFVDKVVLPNYRDFADRTASLSQTLDTFAKSPTEPNLQAARTAWTATRLVWEQTETFAFGPAGSLGLDGAMDTWPVNEVDIEKILAGSTTINGEAIGKLQDSDKGMHSIEYLLFGKEANKALGAFKPREKEYLQALGQDLKANGAKMLVSWEKGVNGQPDYRQVFTTAGQEGNTTYPTLGAGAQEILTGIMDSLTEVGEEKLQAAFKDKGIKGLESRFSRQTINDLRSNLASAENGYLGVYGSSKATQSISSYVAKAKPELDKQVQTEFATAKAALGKVPEPIETHLTDPKAAASIEQAIAAILKVKTTLETQVVPLV
jgi:putative iron-regulated protein